MVPCMLLCDIFAIYLLSGIMFSSTKYNCWFVIYYNDGMECLEHNHDKSKNCNFVIFDQMDVVQYNLAGAQSYYVQSTP